MIKVLGALAFTVFSSILSHAAEETLTNEKLRQLPGYSALIPLEQCHSMLNKIGEKFMKILLALGLPFLFQFSLCSSAWAVTPSLDEASDPSVIIAKESMSDRYGSRLQIHKDGKVDLLTFELLKTDLGPPAWKQVEPPQHHYPQLTAEMVSPFLNPKAPWFTEEEKEQFKDQLKPQVIVKDNPACDSSYGSVKLRNMTTGKLQSIYQFTALCGEINLSQLDDISYTDNAVSLVKLLDALEIMSASGRRRNK